MTSLWARLREQFSTWWAGLGRGQRTAVLVGGIGAGIAVALLVALSNHTSYAPLYTRLRPEDAGEIVAALRERGVPYRLTEGGTAIVVPEEAVYETRLDLAAEGIPRRGVVGFEIFRDSPIGTTDFERMVRYQQALQGELVRTIRELREVVDARVHLTLPERSPFLREERPATASVLLHLRAPLSPEEIRGIAHLVASSVENLHPDNVTILDATGRVLSDAGGSRFGTGLGSQVSARLELQRAFERELELSAQTMLEQVFGTGRAVVRVRAELNFDLLEERQELFEPVVRDRGVVRSQQRLEESFQGMPAPQQAAGIPGVEANIPGYVGVSAEGRGERIEEVANFELNRTERIRVFAPGAVEGLSVAVWVDGDLGPAERQRVEETVISALGLNLARGDRVTVESLSFERPEPVPVMATAAPAPWWQAPWPWLILLVVSLGVVFAVARRRPAQPQPGARIDLEVGDEEELEPRPLTTREERERRSRQQAIETMVREKPEEVAGLLRTWMLEDER